MECESGFLAGWKIGREFGRTMRFEPCKAELDKPQAIDDAAERNGERSIDRVEAYLMVNLRIGLRLETRHCRTLGEGLFVKAVGLHFAVDRSRIHTATSCGQIDPPAE